MSESGAGGFPCRSAAVGVCRGLAQGLTEGTSSGARPVFFGCVNLAWNRVCPVCVSRLPPVFTCTGLIYVVHTLL